jgi:putative flavoprotein involved in K+ transport
VVGAGNSGADIALEVAAAGHEAWVAGEEVSEIPFRPESFLGRNLLQPLVLGVVFMHVLTVNTRLGRKARQGALTRAAPRIRVKRSDLAAAGIERVPRVVGVRSGAPLLADGRTIDVNNVIWCTGFHPGFDWIELPVFGSDGGPMHRSGVVESHPGLYFVGLPFLHSMSSSMVHGVGRDAARIVEAIRRRHGC